MNQDQRTFALLIGGIVVAMNIVSLLGAKLGSAVGLWALGPLGFCALLALGIVYANRGLNTRWLVIAGLSAAGLFVFLQTVAMVLKVAWVSPEGYKTSLQPLWAILSIPGALFGVALPIALGGIFGSLAESDEDRPRFFSVPNLSHTLAFGLLPLLHILPLLKIQGTRVEFSSLWILFVSIPIGVLMVLVGLTLSACRNRFGPPITLGVVVYGLGAAILFALMNLAGVRFTFPP